jgi:hydroxyacylglutathione hydrolase
VKIPLEDNFNDVLGKAQRGLKLSPGQLASRAGVSESDVAQALAGAFNEAVVRKLAPVLGLGVEPLVALGRQAWYPPAHEVAGLAGFTTPFGSYTVNAYLVWDAKTQQAVAFDTGADCRPMLDAAKANGLRISLILLTHVHEDHITDLARLKKETGAPAFVSSLEPTGGAEPFAAGRVFRVGGLGITPRQTSGHSRGGTSYVVAGLDKPVAIVGDALFAASMGGGLVSYEEALRTNRQHLFSLGDDTVLCPGHGPLTTVGEQKKHNPFFPEFNP